jgi:hypothetical protein
LVAVTRSLWFLVLFSALVVAGARCLGAFPGPSAAGDDRANGAALSQASHAPSDRDPPTNGSIDDDSDDSVDPLIEPPAAGFGVVIAPVAELAKASGLAQRGALESHGQGLDRPPRARS